jgi:hypothetical protein
MASLTAIIPIIGALIAGSLGYLSGRLLETRKQLNLQKGQAYADYLKALATSATDHASATAIAFAIEAKTRVCIYGSAPVIKQLSAFEQAGAKIVDIESRRVVAHLVALMRDDMGVSGKPIDEENLHYVLFGRDPSPAAKP